MDSLPYCLLGLEIILSVSSLVYFLIVLVIIFYVTAVSHYGDYFKFIKISGVILNPEF